MSFEEARIDQDPSEMLAMIEHTSQTSVPCTIIESSSSERIIFGFDEAQFTTAMKAAV